MEQMDGPAVTECRRCEDLVASRSRIVNGVGPTDAPLVFVGEAPGAEEDDLGEPFVGRSGSVLDAALRERGLDRTDIRITNCVRCRPPANRDPTVGELSNCRGYLARELDLIDPELVVGLGKVPCEHLLGRTVAVTSEAGSVHEVSFGERRHRVLVSVHPAATLYDRDQEETFGAALDEAVALTGLTEAGGQSRLGDYP